MSDIDQKIAALESKIKRQQITFQIFSVTTLCLVLTSFSLRMKFDRMLDLLEELIRLTALLVN